MDVNDGNKKGMLIIKRKLSEGITINDEIEIFIKKIGKTRITLGIVGPKGTNILRSELGKWNGRLRKESNGSNTE